MGIAFPWALPEVIYVVFLIPQQLSSGIPLAILPTQQLPPLPICRWLPQSLLRLPVGTVFSSLRPYPVDPSIFRFPDCDLCHLSSAGMQCSAVTLTICSVLGNLSWDRTLGNCGTSLSHCSLVLSVVHSLKTALSYLLWMFITVGLV